MKMMLPARKNKGGGFVILYAVVVAGVVSLSGLLLANIVVKQLILSSVGRESQFAYYAANVGDECARQGLFRQGEGHGSFGEFEVGFDGDVTFAPGDGRLLCKNQPIDINDSSVRIINEPALKIFRFANDSVANSNFIVDVIIKPEGGLVISRGYNLKDASHPRRVEKVIYRDYMNDEE